MLDQNNKKIHFIHSQASTTCRHVFTLQFNHKCILSNLSVITTNNFDKRNINKRFDHLISVKLWVIYNFHQDFYIRTEVTVLAYKFVLGMLHKKL